MAPPARSGFGSRVISDMVTLSLDGTVDVQFLPNGLQWRLACPVERVSRGKPDVPR